MSRSSGKFSSFRFTRTGVIAIKRERYFLYKIPGETPSKRTALVKVVATNVYLAKI